MKEIKNIEIHNFDKYVEKVGSFFKSSKLRLYRGQSCDKPLLPKIAREMNSLKNFKVRESELFEEFNYRACQHEKEIKNLNKWENISIAQHYGLPTRLLDWTSNPLTALWFSLSKKQENETDRFVWGVILDNSDILKDETIDPFEIDQTFFYRPKFINLRISNQLGWFSVHNLDNKKSKMQSIEEIERYKIIMAKFIIKINDKYDRNEYLKKLDIFGINYSTVFPDLDGLCKYLDWKMY
jgi:hypothetical protein